MITQPAIPELDEDGKPDTFVPAGASNQDAIAPAGDLTVTRDAANASSAITSGHVATLYHGDCRDLLPSLPADRLITDPVWPNADARLAGSDRPRELLAEALALADVRTVVLQLGRCCDPWFM